MSGSVGGFLRLNATSELAARYATATAQRQETLVETFLVLEQVIASHFTSGNPSRRSPILNGLSVPSGVRSLMTVLSLLREDSGLLHLYVQMQLPGQIADLILSLVAFLTGIAMVIGFFRRGIWGTF